MDTVFLKILNISITASWLVLAVLLMRLVLKKAPKWLMVVMWALVGLRLVLPFNFESVFSLIPSAETVPPEILYETAPEIQTGIPIFNSVVNPVISETLAPNPGDSVNPLQVITFLAGWIWLIGMAGMAVYSLVSCLRIRHKLREAAPLQGNVYLCDQIDTPFIFGLFRPRIYLPSAMDGSDIPFVLAHEQAHLKRKDHLWKPLGFLLLTVYWFNPLLWLAYILLCRDIETACDEKVLQDMGEEVKKPYSQALVNCSVPRRMVAACPLAFGEVNVKSRIKKVLNYKKPAFWLLIAAVVVCIVLSVCFLTNPAAVSKQMQNFLDVTIAEHFQPKENTDYACCVDYEILGTKRNGTETTVYMWVLYEEYSWGCLSLMQETGVHIPTIVTATKENGRYQLVEYWEPRNGSYYAEDIRENFPLHLQRKALNSQRYIKQQKEACREKAIKYFKKNPPTLIYSTDQSHDLSVLEGQFTDKQHALLDYASGLIDSCTFDIDGDGKNEFCELYYGPTYGIFTFILAVYENGTIEYCNCYTDSHSDISFDKQADGTIGIRYASFTDETQYGFYDLQFADGQIQIFRDGTQMHYWGPQEQDPYAPEHLGFKYPKYFDLPTDNGLEVYVWQMGASSYSWGLLPGRNKEYTGSELLNLVPASLDEICAIVASYGLETSQISIHPIYMLHSSYYYEITDAYQDSVEKQFWNAYYGTTPKNTTCERIVLYYHGNLSNPQTIVDPQVCSYLLQQVRRAYAGRQQGESTKGHAGVPYSLELYLTNYPPIEIQLWDSNTFSMQIFHDSEGYPYFFKADISDLYTYLEENFPEELWYGDQAAVSYAGGDSEHLAGIWEEAINQKSLFLSSLYHLPVLKFDTLEEFQQFKARYPEAMDQHWNEVPSFNDVTAQFDDTYFEKNTLVLVYIPSGNGSSRYDILHLFQGRGELSIRICETIHPEIVSNSEANWFITVTLPDVSLETITEYDAMLVDS